MVSDTTLGQKPAISPRRRLKRADIEAVAKLVVKYRMNETEACLECGIAPKTWFNFKQRHKTQEQFEVMINGIRASQLRNCVDSIDDAGTTREYESVNKKGEQVTLTKFGDWRAKAWIAERVLAPERLSDRQGSQTNVNVAIVPSNVLDSLLAKVYAEPVKQQAVIDVEPVKQLPPIDVSK